MCCGRNNRNTCTRCSYYMRERREKNRGYEYYYYSIILFISLRTQPLAARISLKSPQFASTHAAPCSHHVDHVRTRAIRAPQGERLLGSRPRRDTVERGATEAMHRTTPSAMRDNIAYDMVPSRHKSPGTAAGTVAGARRVLFP